MKIVESSIQQHQNSVEKKKQREELSLSGSGIKIEKHQIAQLERQQMDIQEVQQQLSGLLSLSEDGLALAKSQPQEMVLHYSEEDLRKIELLEEFMSRILGKPYKFKHVDRDAVKRPDSTRAWGANAQQARPAQPQGLRVVSRSYYEEYERMSFSSQGQVKLADGSEISFSVNVNYERHYRSFQEQTFEIGMPKDPVVLDLTGEGLDFSNHKLRIDLDLDGTEDMVSAFKSNAGILIHDKDGNDEVSSALEMVGAKDKDGLYSLIAYDEDQNGWIDEGDAVLKQLKLWLIDETGEEKLIGLEEAGVGAIYLGALETPFNFKNGLESIAKMHQSSVYLKEDGKAGSIHAVDYLL